MIVMLTTLANWVLPSATKSWNVREKGVYFTSRWQQNKRWLRFGLRAQHILYIYIFDSVVPCFSIFSISSTCIWAQSDCTIPCSLAIVFPLASMALALSTNHNHQQRTTTTKKMSIKLNLDSFVRPEKDSFHYKECGKVERALSSAIFHSCSGICYNFDLQYCRRMTFM